MNCLCSSHFVNKCSSNMVCKTCCLKNYLLLHYEVTQTSQSASDDTMKINPTVIDSESRQKTANSVFMHRGTQRSTVSTVLPQNR